MKHPQRGAWGHDLSRALARTRVYFIGMLSDIFRTLKENLLWVRTFDTVEQLRHALIAFREVYNTTWLIERHGFRPPAALRAEQLSPAAKAA